MQVRTQQRPILGGAYLREVSVRNSARLYPYIAIAALLTARKVRLPSSVMSAGSLVTIIACGFSSNSDLNVSSRVEVTRASDIRAADIAICAAIAARLRRATTQRAG